MQSSERNWIKIWSNERIFKWIFVHYRIFLNCPVYFEKLVELFYVTLEISTNILSLTGAGKILPARKPHPHSAPRTAPYPHPHSGVCILELVPPSLKSGFVIIRNTWWISNLMSFFWLIFKLKFILAIWRIFG